MFVHKNKNDPKVAPLGDISFYIDLYREIHLKLFSWTNNPNTKEFHMQHHLDMVWL